MSVHQQTECPPANWTSTSKGSVHQQTSNSPDLFALQTLSTNTRSFTALQPNALIMSLFMPEETPVPQPWLRSRTVGTATLPWHAHKAPSACRLYGRFNQGRQSDHPQPDSCRCRNECQATEWCSWCILRADLSNCEDNSPKYFVSSEEKKSYQIDCLLQLCRVTPRKIDWIPCDVANKGYNGEVTQWQRSEWYSIDPALLSWYSNMHRYLKHLYRYRIFLKVNVKQSHNRSGQALSVPGGWGSIISTWKW